jgi:hypothetical protein
VFKLYLFHPGRTLVQAMEIHNQKEIDRLNKWIKSYNAEEGTRLIRAVLGQETLTVLGPDEDLRLPTEFATPIKRVK